MAANQRIIKTDGRLATDHADILSTRRFGPPDVGTITLPDTSKNILAFYYFIARHVRRPCNVVRVSEERS